MKPPLPWKFMWPWSERLPKGHHHRKSRVCIVQIPAAHKHKRQWQTRQISSCVRFALDSQLILGPDSPRGDSLLSKIIKLRVGQAFPEYGEWNLVAI
jgi:hypothetical protein